MTPRPPPGGMVLPNAFGLLSKKSFKRSSSSKGDSAQVSLSNGHQKSGIRVSGFATMAPFASAVSAKISSWQMQSHDVCAEQHVQ